MKRCTTKNCKRPIHGHGLCMQCYYIANQAHIQITHRKWAKANRKKVKADHQAWRLAHRKDHKKYNRTWNETHAARVTVKSHYRYIFVMGLPTYRKMPFFDGWNPDKGGSYAAGEEWIIENIGRRPDKTHQLHIVDRRLGFMPGNLQWVPRNKHQQEEMIAKLLLENQRLRLRHAESDPPKPEFQN